MEQEVMYMCNCGYYFKTEELALDCPLHTNSDLANTPRIDQHGQVLVELQWNGDTTRLLIDTCISQNVMGSCKTNKEKQDRWTAVGEIFKKHGYAVPSSDVLRKKWYNLYQKYKTIKDGKRQSGAGSVSWEFFQLMDDLLAKDPTITPVATLTTRPLGRSPLSPVDPSSDTIGGASTNSSQSSSDAPSSKLSLGQAGPSPRTSRTRRRRNTSTEEEDVDLKRALLMDIKDRKVYREEKLQVLKDIASFIRGGPQPE